MRLVQLTVCLLSLVGAREEAERHQREKAELQARVDGLAGVEAEAKEPRKAIAELGEKFGPAELLPCLVGDVEALNVEAQELGSEVDGLESVVASGEEEVKKANGERDKARLFSQPSVKEALAAGSFNNALAQIRVFFPELDVSLVDQSHAVSDGRIIKPAVAADGTRGPEVIYLRES